MKPVDVMSDSYVEYNENLNKKDPKFKIGDHVRTAKYKTFLQQDIPQIGQKKFLSLVKLKIHCHGHT